MYHCAIFKCVIVRTLSFDYLIVSRVSRANHMKCTNKTKTSCTFTKMLLIIIIVANRLLAICDYHRDYQLFDRAIVSRVSQGNPLIGPTSRLLFVYIAKELSWNKSKTYLCHVLVCLRFFGIDYRTRCPYFCDYILKVTNPLLHLYVFPPLVPVSQNTSIE